MQQEDSEAQVGSSGGQDWRTFDFKKAMRALASNDEQVRKKALQRLHSRWWHVQTEGFQRILRAAGAPSRAVSDVPSVVQACSICRDWKHPGEKSMTSSRLVDHLNEEVQFDLLFDTSRLEPARGTIPIVHLCDCFTRFSRRGVTPSKEERALTQMISELWVSIFGRMETLTLDQESGMRGEHATVWAQQNSIHLKFKAPRQKAWVVERHNEIIRQALHRTEEAARREGIE